MIVMSLKEAFFEDLARHLQVWRDDLVKAITDPAKANWAESQDAIDRLAQRGFSQADIDDLRTLLDECFRGILHSTLVTIDGGTVMSEVGTVALVDADTNIPLTTGALHEEFVEFLADRNLI